MLQDEFEERMQVVYRRGKLEGRYSAPLFASMLKEFGGLGSFTHRQSRPDSPLCGSANAWT